jgi:hypothetical protein
MPATQTPTTATPQNMATPTPQVYTSVPSQSQPQQFTHPSAQNAAQGLGSPARFAQPPLQPQAIPLSQPIQKRSKQTLLLIGLGVGAVLILALGVLFASKTLNPSITLTTYSNDSYSMLVPKGYTQSASGSDGLTFKEATGEDNARSEVVVFYRAIPAGMNASDLTKVKDTLKDNLLTAVNSSTENDAKIVNVKTTDITFKGSDAIKLTASSQTDGKTTGNYTLVASVSTKGMFIVGVEAHKSDPALAKKTDQIINSFTLK